jgi:hypothetical protein
MLEGCLWLPPPRCIHVQLSIAKHILLPCMLVFAVMFFGMYGSAYVEAVCTSVPCSGPGTSRDLVDEDTLSKALERAFRNLMREERGRGGNRGSHRGRSSREGTTSAGSPGAAAEEGGTSQGGTSSGVQAAAQGVVAAAEPAPVGAGSGAGSTPGGSADATEPGTPSMVVSSDGVHSGDSASAAIGHASTDKQHLQGFHMSM